MSEDDKNEAAIAVVVLMSLGAAAAAAVHHFGYLDGLGLIGAFLILCNAIKGRK